MLYRCTNLNLNLVITISEEEINQTFFCDAELIGITWTKCERWDAKPFEDS